MNFINTKKGLSKYAGGIIVACTIVYASALFWRYGTGMFFIQGLVLLFVLMYASISDIRTRMVGDFVPVEILILDKAVDSLSWTLWRDVAEWFAERHEHYGQEKQHLYKATISADDVIAFTNSRREFEIIQYRGVRDIEELPRIGVSAEYKELFSATSYDFHKDQENRTTALDLFARWYRQNNAMRET